MRIRAIELVNLRRFAGQRARIDGIGDGITVLAAPNETGKSTFFDALHALFFLPHRSKAAGAKALQPHAGGAPEAAVEIELPQGRFRLEKRWLLRPMARVLDATGRLIAQEDEAEAWIDRLLGAGLAGPTGLLWVRQGVLGLEPADRAERDRHLAARRDLLSAVAGEIELMTGGRRMDQVLARVGAEIARLATATLRPKAGGEWAQALETAETLGARRDELAAKAARLAGDLNRRATIQRRLQELADPMVLVRNQQALVTAQEALHQAEAHARQVEQAATMARLATLTAREHRQEIDRLTGLRDRLATATAADQTAANALGALVARLDQARQDEAAATATHEAAATTLTGLGQRLAAAQRARLALAGQERLETLRHALGRGESLRQRIEAGRAARANLAITPERLEQAEVAQTRRDRLAAQVAAAQVAVTLEYHGAARIHHGGQPLAAGTLRLQTTTRLDLPGIGTLTVDPGSDRGGGAGDLPARLVAAEQALVTALAACGTADLATARTALAQARQLEGSAEQAVAMLAEIAPQGLEALRSAVLAAQGAITTAAEPGPDPASGPEDPTALEAALIAARHAEEGARHHRRTAEARRATTAEEHAAAAATARLTAQERAAAMAAAAVAGDPMALAARLLALGQEQAVLAQQASAAADRLATLRAEAPDLATAQAAVDRLQSVLTAQQQEQARLGEELAGVNGSIGALADEGIDEALAEATEREAAASERAARYAHEVAALVRLRDALESARHAAREAYFGPVMHELAPLLAILHPGASLQIDDGSLLPASLTRDGQAEGLDILSGGTREQLAVLTRLAFARLFARAGQPVPVILDDALVHSDDHRIEAMFTALHRVARDQQIIVLTCRQRAFAPLGGAPLHLQVTPA